MRPMPPTDETDPETDMDAVGALMAGEEQAEDEEEEEQTTPEARIASLEADVAELKRLMNAG